MDGRGGGMLFCYVRRSRIIHVEGREREKVFLGMVDIALLALGWKKGGNSLCVRACSENGKKMRRIGRQASWHPGSFAESESLEKVAFFTLMAVKRGGPNWR